MPFYAYILKSLANNSYYKGSTSDINKRLKYHNSGKSKYSKKFRPWVIHYYELFNSRQEAVKRELFFKSIDGYLWLKKNGII